MSASENLHIEDRRNRVAALTARDNPSPDHDALVRLEASHPLAFPDPSGGDRAAGDTTTVRVDYVPDRLIIAGQGFRAYLDGLQALTAETPEALAALILDDLMDELVPRWISVVVDRGGHRVRMEDGQPHWSNTSLLARS